MCGIVGYVGSVNPDLVKRVVEESKVRGLHHLGSKVIKSAGIYHTRYCTSGEINQPLNVNGTWMVFNGVIDMGTKKEMENRWKLKLATDNDGEIILRQNSAVSFLTMYPCSFAGLFLTNKRLMAIRNKDRPLWMIEVKKSVLLASTLDILKRAGADWKKAKQLEPLKLYSWTI